MAWAGAAPKVVPACPPPEMRILVPPALSPLAIAARVPNAPVESLGGRTMGTSWSVRLVLPPALGLSLSDIETVIQKRLDEVIAQMSHWEETSLLCRYNTAAPGSWHELPIPFRTVLKCAHEIAGHTGGAFDPTIGAVVDLWGFGPAPLRTEPPAQREIEAALALGGWQKLEFDISGRRLLQPGGLRLDFSGIAKGFAVDHVANALQHLGLRHFLVEIGGELRGEGVKPDASPWWVAIERPAYFSRTPAHLDLGNWPETRIALHGLSIATSGDYRRWFESKGRRYSHTLDPRTGWPVNNGVISVTVLQPSCMMADAWATALSVLGGEAALALAEASGVAAHLIRRNGDSVEEFLSPALREMLD